MQLGRRRWTDAVKWAVQLNARGCARGGACSRVAKLLLTCADAHKLGAALQRHEIGGCSAHVLVDFKGVAAAAVVITAFT